jgi:hypothetical protein
MEAPGNGKLLFRLVSKTQLSEHQKEKYSDKPLHTLVPKDIGNCWINVELDTTRATGWNWKFAPAGDAIRLHDQGSTAAADQYFSLSRPTDTSLRFFAYVNSVTERTDGFNLNIVMNPGTPEQVLIMVDPDIKNPADP